MRNLTPLAPADAPQRSSELLGEIIDRHGSVGDMVATMAHSPALLQGYLDLSKAMKRVKLHRQLSEKVALAVQSWIGCETCLAAHTEAARAAGLSETDIVLAREGAATDRRESTLVSFALRVLAEPGSITGDDIAELRQHGWTDRIIVEVVGLVALNLMTGAFNLVAGIEPTSQPANAK
ncbi:carboxymuconolactone decarboxylase family protein [Kibdelosporangium persicum]|uniref:Alkyl hydroperoxide reductase AhpD n=1 Tax=Kibdelosporangium persicum TaxID=2698649 RepID=A0ABX2FI09_9PSEU|nr:carboxymuconolactone decarboxylase family protein [Kibdelosporangium persicum]NRN71044.1 Alkyl hydroperoxide reductase AhpD [Kibdelosporangium persicum]